MRRIPFTDEEMDQLKANPYTLSVSPTCISFTKAFKEAFWNSYTTLHKGPSDIVRELGYNPTTLGTNRIANIPRSLKEEYDKTGTFHDGPKTAWNIGAVDNDAADASDGSKQAAKPSEKPTYEDLVAQVKFLTQEVEYLKKTFLAMSSRKR